MRKVFAVVVRELVLFTTVKVMLGEAKSAEHVQGMDNFPRCQLHGIRLYSNTLS